MSDPCPCGSERLFDACCGPFLSGTGSVAPTAEALMRSRFTAFVRGATDYLIESHHPAARSMDERGDLLRSLARMEWLNLLVLHREGGGADEDTGIVEFAAAYRTRPDLALGTPAGKVGQMHERSRFVRDGGLWLYVDGEQLPAHVPSRAAPCWCGSGKKYKRCHG